jgi:NADH-quinone oxidoreductase subunit F
MLPLPPRRKAGMMRTVEDLKAVIAGKIRERGADRRKRRIVISAGTCGRARGSLRVEQAFREQIEKHGLQKEVELKVSGCHGFCEAEPNVVIKPEGVFYQKLNPEDAQEIVSETLLGGKIIDRLLYVDPNTNQQAVHEDDIPFYKKQRRLLLGSNSLLDPTRIDDYFAIGGYRAFLKVLGEMSPEGVVDEVKKSGLRGRGGAGFPTGYKWEFCRKSQGEVRYIVCNADEGDPGAYMDRSLLEGNPHSVIEGMLIGAFAVGAKEGWIYVRHEYPLAVENVDIAIRQAKDQGLLGENILGSGFSFDIHVATGAGAFVCGEETALIASIEGKRGMPRQRPPFPVRRGLWGKPTNINNVETWANVPLIIKNGASWYSQIGTEGSKGTKIFSLVGKIKNTGLVEVPMGITLREVVYDIGGGIPGNSQFKAVQTGGPSGGCLPRQLLSLPVDYDSLAEAGSIMGSGGMIVMDERTCMVDVAKYFLGFLQDESCGKCLPCRKGTQKMLEIVTDITEGKATEEDLHTLEELAQVVRDTSLCGLGQTAPNPVLATLRYFRREYDDHVKREKCQAAVCKEITSSPCQHTCPIDTEAAVYIGLIARGRYDEALQVIKKDNPFASVLARVCHHPCEEKCRAGEAGEPIRIRNLKRFITDYGLKNGLMLKAEFPGESRKEKVAIIGSGPAGLTCAFYLAQMGYQVTVFEKHPVAGGMLAVGVPEFRLPRDILKADIDYIKSAGVEVRTNCCIGKDLKVDDLVAQGYKAIFAATGAHKSLKLGAPGESTKGVVPGMQVLTAINLGEKVEVGKKVGVIGGGNSAVDAARAVLRTGMPDSVTIFYRRTINEMPAYQEEVQGALEEGVKIEFLTAPRKVIAEKGKLSACEFTRMEMGEVDHSGRRRPIPIDGSEFKVKLDTLIVAIGEEPDTSFAKRVSGLEFSKWGTLLVDEETFASSRSGFFAGGDLTTGPNTVVEAVASGKIAAESIHKFLSGQELEREYRLTRPSRYVEPVELSEEEVAQAKSPSMPELSAQERKGYFKEVEKGLTEDQAVKEARRCLRCDLETRDGQEFLEHLRKGSRVTQEVTDA